MNEVNSVSKNFLYLNGFTMISNLLFEYQQYLNITDDELLFIIRLYKYANLKNYKIHDKDLDPTLCEKSLQRRRNSLREKGYLKYSVFKMTDPKTKKITTAGISYDLSPLEEQLEAISAMKKKELQKEVEKMEKNSKLISSEEAEKEFEEDEYLQEYKFDWELYYGEEYKMTEDEKRLWQKASTRDKKIISKALRVFEYNAEITKFTPRLSMFLKLPFRLVKLKHDWKWIMENDPYMVNKQCYSYRDEEQQIDNILKMFEV